MKKEEVKNWKELLDRPENDDDYASTNIGYKEGNEQRTALTEVSLKRQVVLKNKGNYPHGWNSCILAFNRHGMSIDFQGLIDTDLELLGQFLIDYAHRLRNY